ncbi:MAG: gamma-glutamyltransferase family protein [Hyphomicrobiaceae bacterium]|nr:gamma-glutamyltransferase family protein [Hyphomicrobiaceae bacterium]MCC0009786.1 gamma-glutamyltransferase family protein [Hyphomicrobiaceae bacterium]
MFRTTTSRRGMVVTPHHLASEAGLSVLRDGGNAVEAMIAAASTIAVVYPHMNGLGGDNFWLISSGGQDPIAIDACGPAAQRASCEFYRDSGHTTIPMRGPLSALTVAGAVGGWQMALAHAQSLGGRMPLSRLLADATSYAREGFPVSETQAVNSRNKLDELRDQPGFAQTYLDNGEPPLIGATFRNPALAATLEQLARAGLEDFYRGDVGQTMARELEAAGSPLRQQDLDAYRARRVTPLSVRLRHGRVFNLPPPTQGLASLMILGLAENLSQSPAESFSWLHGLVEATKRAFLIRNEHVFDPTYMTIDPQSVLEAGNLLKIAKGIDMANAMPWPQPANPGDTVWLGAIDAQGNAVSFIQSIYWEFGSGVVLPTTGIVWQNRGVSFSLDDNNVNVLKPGRYPFHTIQPALALLDDRRVMPYGTMGGEGQPQTQSAIYSRYVIHGQGLQEAISGPRWLLGRTWGADATNLRMESRFDAQLVAAMRNAGHDVELVGPYDEVMGHAGALVAHRSGDRTGLIEGASDPRSDGRAAGF